MYRPHTRSFTHNLKNRRNPEPSPPKSFQVTLNPMNATGGKDSLSRIEGKGRVTKGGKGVGQGGLKRHRKIVHDKIRDMDMNRQKTSKMTSRISDSGDLLLVYKTALANCEMTLPSSDSGESPPTHDTARDAALNQAVIYKKEYEDYKKLYIEVTQMESPPKEKLDELLKMHARLAGMKEEINQGFGDVEE